VSVCSQWRFEFEFKLHVDVTLTLFDFRFPRFGYGGCDSTDPRCDYATVDCDHVGDFGVSDAAFVSAVLRLRLGRLWRFGYGGCDSTDPRCDYATVDCDHVDGFWRFGCGFCFGGTATTAAVHFSIRLIVEYWERLRRGNLHPIIIGCVCHTPWASAAKIFLGPSSY